MDEFKVGDIVKTIRQSCGVNFSEAVVVGRYEKYICVIAKTRRDYDDWLVYSNDIIKTKQELLDDRDLELAKIVSTITKEYIIMTDKKFFTNTESAKLVSFKELNNGDVFIGGSQFFSLFSYPA